jgi:hypothetical protein
MGQVTAYLVIGIAAAYAVGCLYFLLVEFRDN